MTERLGPALLVLAAALTAQSPENEEICEVKPFAVCLGMAEVDGAHLRYPVSDVGIMRDAFTLCGTAGNEISSADIVLVMDNTGSMGKIQEVEGIARYCADVGTHENDPDCISGDPNSLRGPALHAFLDSALARDPAGTRVGVVLFSNVVTDRSSALRPLTQQSIGDIKSEIRMRANGVTNYTAAFNAAMSLLEGSTKPRDRRVIIFVSDGRPNRPNEDPYMYKQDWDEWPVVHSIFLGDNTDDTRDLREISQKTGGLFFQIRDVERLAGILTEDIIQEVFRDVRPDRTVITNGRTGARLEVPQAGHVYRAASGGYEILTDGPIYLEEGENPIHVRTEYDDDSPAQEVSFTIDRVRTGPFHTPVDRECRDLPRFVLYNADGEPISELGLPYRLNDPRLDYALITDGAPDTFTVYVETTDGDREDSRNRAAENRRSDSRWENSLPFEHLTGAQPADGDVQTQDGRQVTLRYRNPHLPPDSASITVSLSLSTPIAGAAYFDEDGDGAMETVRIRFEKNLDRPPSQLEFRVEDGGKGHVRRAQASRDEIAFAQDAQGNPQLNALVVTLKNPFPAGITSTGTGESQGRTFTDPEVPLGAGYFAVDDSVPPVIRKADVENPDGSGLPRQVRVTLSEPVTLPASETDVFRFKRETREFTPEEVRIARVERAGERVVVLHVDPSSPYVPVGADSVSLRPRSGLADAAGNQPADKRYRELGGPRLGQELDGLRVTFPSGGGAVSPAPMETETSRFVPVDRDGRPLPGHGCANCVVFDDGKFVGPVIHVRTSDPVRYEFFVFTNLGDFVVSHTGELTREDLRHLDKETRDGGKTVYLHRVVWNGRAETGRLAGTGAYVLKARFFYPRNLETGAVPSEDQRLYRFGFLR